MYDDEVDVLYIEFRRTDVSTQHVTDAIALDYDADGRLAGIEILGASAVLAAAPTPDAPLGGGPEAALVPGARSGRLAV